MTPAGLAYQHVFNINLPVEHKQHVELAVEEIGLDAWAEALLFWREKRYNPSNLYAILHRAEQLKKSHGKSQLPVVTAIDPIFVEPAKENEP